MSHHLVGGHKTELALLEVRDCHYDFVISVEIERLCFPYYSNNLPKVA